MGLVRASNPKVASSNLAGRALSLNTAGLRNEVVEVAAGEILETGPAFINQIQLLFAVRLVGLLGNPADFGQPGPDDVRAVAVLADDFPAHE
jgi:hypothetical protein